MKGSVCPRWTRTCDLMCPLCLPGGKWAKLHVSCLLFTSEPLNFSQLRAVLFPLPLLIYSEHVSERLMQQRGQESGSSECKVYHVVLGFYCYSKQEFNATQGKQAVAQSCCSSSPQSCRNNNIYIGCSHLVFQHKQVVGTVIARQNLLPSFIFGIHLNAGAIYESGSYSIERSHGGKLSLSYSNKSSQVVR